MKKTVRSHKKIIICLVIGAALLMLCLFFIIKVKDSLKNSGVGFPETYFIAAFDTTEYKNDTNLIYYDEKFLEVYRQHISWGNACDPFYPPVLLDGKIYIAPIGAGLSYDADEVIEIDKKTGKHKKYKTNQHYVQGMAVSEKYIFTVNDWNYTAVIARTEKESQKVSELEFPDELCSQIDLYEDNLYCFLLSENEGVFRTRCLIIDIETLEEVKSFDISEYGQGPHYTYMKDGILYMPIPLTKEDEPCNLLLMYNTQTEELKEVELAQELPGQIVEYKNKLLITHVNYSHSDVLDCSVSMYNPENGEVDNYKVQSVLEQVAVKGNQLYALDVQEQAVFVYNLDSKGEELELVEKYTLQSKQGTSSYRYYIGGFFMK